jgi:hypothetical protein
MSRNATHQLLVFLQKVKSTMTAGEIMLLVVETIIPLSPRISGLKISATIIASPKFTLSLSATFIKPLLNHSFNISVARSLSSEKFLWMQTVPRPTPRPALRLSPGPWLISGRTYAAAPKSEAIHPLTKPRRWLPYSESTWVAKRQQRSRSRLVFTGT